MSLWRNDDIIFYEESSLKKSEKICWHDDTGSWKFFFCLKDRVVVLVTKMQWVKISINWLFEDTANANYVTIYVVRFVLFFRTSWSCVFKTKVLLIVRLVRVTPIASWYDQAGYFFQLFRGTKSKYRSTTFSILLRKHGRKIVYAHLCSEKF